MSRHDVVFGGPYMPEILEVQYIDSFWDFIRQRQVKSQIFKWKKPENFNEDEVFAQAYEVLREEVDNLDELQK